MREFCSRLSPEAYEPLAITLSASLESTANADKNTALAIMDLAALASLRRWSNTPSKVWNRIESSMT